MNTLVTPAMQRITLAGSLITLLYWSLVLYTNVYRVTIFGIIYEILWLPMIAFVFLLPAVSMYQVFRLRQVLSPFSPPVFSLVCTVITIVMILFWESPAA